MNETPRSGVAAYGALAFGILSISFSAIFVRWADAPGVVTAFYRVAIAVVITTPFFFHRWRASRGQFNRRALLLIILAGLLFAADISIWSTAIMLSGAIMPTFLANLAPIWVGIGAYFLFREQLRLPFWGGLILAVLGMLFLVGGDALGEFGLNGGAALGVLAGVFYAGYYLVVQRARATLGVILFLWPTMVTSMIVLAAAAVIMGAPLAGYSPNSYLSFLAIGLISQIGGQFALGYALGYLPASVVAPAGLLQPVFTALLALVLLDERLSLLQTLGAAIILCGVYLVHAGRLRRQRRLAAAGL